MEKITNWLKLWEQLSKAQSRAFGRKKESRGEDFWKHKARHFDDMVKKRWAHPDSSRDFVVSKLRENPGSTIMDIGA